MIAKANRVFHFGGRSLASTAGSCRHSINSGSRAIRGGMALATAWISSDASASLSASPRKLRGLSPARDVSVKSSSDWRGQLEGRRNTLYRREEPLYEALHISQLRR